MGVMPCYRTDCRNILCDQSLNDHYICGECIGQYQTYKEEWINLNKNEELTKQDIINMIEKFFETTKDEIAKVQNEDIENTFRSLENFGD